MSKKMILVDADDFLNIGSSRNRGIAPHNELKTYKKFKKFLQEEETAKKKPGPPEMFPNWSVGKKMCFFAIFGPPLGIGYVFGLVILVRGLASFIVGWH